MGELRAVCKEICREAYLSFAKFWDTLPRIQVVASTQSHSFLLLVSAGSIALFLWVATVLLICNTIGSTIHEYLQGIYQIQTPAVVLSPCWNGTAVLFQVQQPSEEGSTGSMSPGESESGTKVLAGLTQEWSSPISSGSVSGNEEIEVGRTIMSGLTNDSILKNDSETYSDGLASLYVAPSIAPLPSPPSSDFEKEESRSCDLFHGKWVYDPAGPLYTNNTCPIIVGAWDCQGNGRPDRDYEYWRWRPDQCDLPRFDGRKFLELLRGKTLAFIGDSLARNQMESILCMLWQVETPKQLIHPWMHKWYFKSTSTTIARIWSAWLINTTTDPFPLTPPGLLKMQLDTPDDKIVESLPQFDVVVVSSGHWFFKQAAYLRNDEIVGGNLWLDPTTATNNNNNNNKKRRKKAQQFIDNFTAYGIAMKTVLTAIAKHPDYNGLTILRTYSPDHQTGSAEGKCGSLDSPESKQVWKGRTEVMYRRQTKEFERAARKVSNGARFRLMDITEVSGRRHDGHPGPYFASFDLGAARKRGWRPPPVMDCGHWCMPGLVDTWNEILAEIIRRELV